MTEVEVIVRRMDRAPQQKEKEMKQSLVIGVLLLGVAMGVSLAQTKDVPSKDPADAQGVTLFSYRRSYKMTPSPTLSDGFVIRIKSVELLGVGDKATTKTTCAPHYGKISSDSLTFRTKHETQSIGIDHVRHDYDRVSGHSL